MVPHDSKGANFLKCLMSWGPTILKGPGKQRPKRGGGETLLK